MTTETGGPAFQIDDQKVQRIAAEHELLQAESGVEYAQALVTYNKNRVKRLKAYLGKTEEAT